MIREADGVKFFGFFKGQPYGHCDEDIDEYRHYKNTLPRDVILKHMESQECGYALIYTVDPVTGEHISAGVHWDMPFCYPIDFVMYYRAYDDIGIPPEYEKHLIEVHHLG